MYRQPPMQLHAQLSEEGSRPLHCEFPVHHQHHRDVDNAKQVPGNFMKFQCWVFMELSSQCHVILSLSWFLTLDDFCLSQVNYYACKFKEQKDS